MWGCRSGEHNAEAHARLTPPRPPSLPPCPHTAFFRSGVGRGAGRVARVAEEVGRAPQEADAGPGHVGLCVVEDRLEIGGRLGKGRAGWGDVTIVEAEVGDAELLGELEGRIEP